MFIVFVILFGIEYRCFVLIFAFRRNSSYVRSSYCVSYACCVCVVVFLFFVVLFVVIFVCSVFSVFGLSVCVIVVLDVLLVLFDSVCLIVSRNDL